MRFFIFALLVASCYASPLLSGTKVPVVATQTSAPKLVTVTRPVPSVPKIVTIDKKVHIPSAPKIVTVHKQVSVPTQVVVPRPIPSPPRIITIERPVPVPQTVIVDKPYLVPTPVIIPRPVPVYVNEQSAVANRAPISLQPIVASGPLPRPLPTPLANAQSLVTGKTSAGAITVGHLEGPIHAGDRLFGAHLFAPAHIEAARAAAALNRTNVHSSFEQQSLLHYNLALANNPFFVPVNFSRPTFVPGNNYIVKPNFAKDNLERHVAVSGKFNAPHFPSNVNAPIYVNAHYGTLGAPLTPEQQLLVNKALALQKGSVVRPANLKA